MGIKRGKCTICSGDNLGLNLHVGPDWHPDGFLDPAPVIIVTEHVFQAKGPNVTAYMELSFLFPRHELPRLARAAMEANPDGITAPQIASHVMAVKALNADDRHLRRSISYKVVQIMRRWEKERKAVREKKIGTAIVWRFKP